MLDLNLIQKQVNDDTPKALDTHTLLTLIKLNHQRYFRCKALVDDALAHIYKVSLKQILDCKKRIADRDPFEPDRVSLRPKITHLLKKLEQENKIEKYGPKVWRLKSNE